MRKWCLALEKYNYAFTRNDQNQRLFFHKDIVALSHFKKMVQDSNFSLDNASVVISSRFNDSALPDETQFERAESTELSVPETRFYDSFIGKLMEHIETQEEHSKNLEEHIRKQEEFNKELILKLEKQLQYIEERLNERDRTLIESLREVQKTKK